MNTVTEEFKRVVYSIFGLPFDNLTINTTKELIRIKTKQPGNFVLSTINVNWVAQSIRDPDFRETIIDSDIVTIDGMPLVWLTKLFGCSDVTTVAGSTLIHELHQDKEKAKQLTIFLFGGDRNVAQKAMKKVNSEKGGLKVVGALNPGFGTIQDMSRDEFINAINSKKPDILLVALGAVKGSKWIALNRKKLNAKVISHLGATINFMAGTLKRAPKTISRIGAEWIWRIIQEPKLFRRYIKDGLLLLKVLCLNSKWLLKYIYYSANFSRKNRKFYARIEQNGVDVKVIVFENNDKPANHYSPMEAFCFCAELKKMNIALDLKNVKFLDLKSMGLISLLAKNRRSEGLDLIVKNACENIISYLRFFVFRNDIISISKSDYRLCFKQNT